MLVVKGRGWGVAESPIYASEMDPLGVLESVANAEGTKYNSRSFRWVIVMLVEEAEVILQPWACSKAVTCATLLLVSYFDRDEDQHTFQAANFGCRPASALFSHALGGLDLLNAFDLAGFRRLDACLFFGEVILKLSE